MIEALDYVTLLVPDLAASVRFYAEGLGLALLESSSGFVLLSAGNCRLGLHAGGAPAPERAVNLHFRVADVDNACAELAARGIIPMQPPRDQPWGLRSAAFTDPSGYTVELVGPVYLTP